MQAGKTIARFVAWTLAALILLLLIGRLAMAPLASHAIVGWFEQRGLEARVDDIGFDLADGRLVLLGLTVGNDGEQALALPRAEIAWDWSALAENRLRLTAITIDGLDFEILRDQQGGMIIAGIDLSGTAEPVEPAAEEAAAEPPGWTVELAGFEMRDTRLCYRGPPELDYCNTLSNLAWDGELSYALADLDSNALPLKAEGAFRLAGFESRSNQLQRVLARFDNLAFETLSIDSVDSIAIAAITLEAVNLFERASPDNDTFIEQIDSLQVRDIRLEQGKLLTISDIQITGNATRVVKSSADEFDYSAWLRALGQAPDASTRDGSETAGSEEEKATAVERSAESKRLDESSEPAPETDTVTDTALTPAADSSSADFAFALGRFGLRSEKPLEYRDLSLDEPFVIGFSATELEILGLDNRNPDQPSKISYRARLDGRDLLTIEGTATPLAAKPSLDMTGEIEDLDLRRLSPFTVAEIGYRIRSGQLDANIKISGEQGILDGIIDLRLYKLELQALSKEDAEKMESRFGFPLNPSLSLLKDREGNIELEVPVRGDMRSPEFGTGDIINKALASAVTAAVLNYYTPFGLVTAADSLFSLATALRFEPVVFEPGDSDFVPAEADDLDRISELMKERPGVHLTLCPYTNTVDRLKLFPRSATSSGQELVLDDAQKAGLAELGEARAAAVRKALAEKEVDVGRLVACTPQHEEGEAPSRVEISI